MSGGGTRHPMRIALLVASLAVLLVLAPRARAQATGAADATGAGEAARAEVDRVHDDPSDGGDAGGVDAGGIDAGDADAGDAEVGDAEAGDAEPEEEGGLDDAAAARGDEDVVGRLGVVIGEIGESLAPRRDTTSRLQWDATWPRYRFDELVVTLGMGLVIGLEELLPTRGDPNWRAVTDLDTEASRSLGLPDPFARDVLEEVSSGITAALFLWPAAFDSLIYAGLGEGAWDVAWQLSLISLEVFTVNHAIGVLVRLLTRRERPLGRFCTQEPGYDADPICRAQPAAESFWSSHTSNAFAGAALVCMHHDVVDLFGDEVSDGMACGGALALAVTTGLFRVMSDQNWITDVMTGAVVGSLSGILIPWLLHFQGGARPPLHGSEAPTITFMPMMGDDQIGLMSNGVW